jgi:hypothetical protein
MRPLIDADILLYEIGFAGQETQTSVEKIGGEFFKKTKTIPRDWDLVKSMLDNRIELISKEVEATLPPLLFLTNTDYINGLLNKKRKFEGDNVVEFVPNFREKVAEERKYKGGRKEEKPFHYKNLISYIISNYDYRVANGLEADDIMCIYQYDVLWDSVAAGLEPSTIICSRDKDLRQCPGWHYSWECGKQYSVGPIFVDSLGWLEKKANGKVWGVGNKFFYYQLLTGDSVDNIIGVMGRGPAFAYKLLKDVETEYECYQLVAEVYIKQFGDDWEEKMREMIDLLWIIKTEDEQGEPVRWTKPMIV